MIPANIGIQDAGVAKQIELFSMTISSNTKS